MTEHPADDDEAIARKWEARAGLPPGGRDPHTARQELIDDRDAAMIALAALRPDRGAAVPDAVELALAGARPEAAANMPYAAAWAILQRVPDRHRPDMIEAVGMALDRFDEGDRTPALAELAVHHVADAARAGIAASIADELHGAVDHDGHPIDDDQIVRAASGAAGIAVEGIVDSLREHLLVLAGLP